MKRGLLFVASDVAPGLDRKYIQDSIREAKRKFPIGLIKGYYTDEDLVKLRLWYKEWLGDE